MSTTIVIQTTAELFRKLEWPRGQEIVVIQTDCRDLVIGFLQVAGATHNQKSSLLSGIEAMKQAITDRSQFIVPVFLHTHPVGMLPDPFVKLIVNKINCRVDGLAEELLKGVSE